MGHTVVLDDPDNLSRVNKKESTPDYEAGLALALSSSGNEEVLKAIETSYQSDPRYKR
jgi:hypothetical protein